MVSRSHSRHDSTCTVPVLVVRVSGLPLGVLRELRFDRTMTLVDEVLRRSERIRAEGERISGLLYTVIGGTADKPTRYRLLALRRDVYYGRRPKDQDSGTEVRAVLPSAVAGALDEWLTELCQFHELRDRIGAVLTRETSRRRHHLRSACADSRFQAGLLRASEQLHQEVVKWLGASERQDPHLETTLVKYLSRAATKTSPFSTLTSTGFGRWTRSGLSGVEHNQDWCRHSVVELNLLVTRAIADRIAGWQELQSDLIVRLNPSVVSQDRSIRFLTGPTRERHQESVVEITRISAIQNILAVFHGNKSYRRPDLIQMLAALMPCTREEEISDLIDRLISLGLLEARLPLTDQSSDHLADLHELLSRHDGSRVERLRASVTELRVLLRSYAQNAAPDIRSACAEHIRATVTGVTRSLSIPIAAPLRRNLFYEDTMADVEVRLPAAIWDTVSQELALVHRLAAIYDLSLPARLSASEFFAACYGTDAVVDVLTFFRDFSAHGTTTPLRLGEISSLQRRIADHVVRHPVDPDGMRRLDPAALGAELEAWPPYLAPPRTLTVYGQLTDSTRSPILILNDIFCGRSRSLARQIRVGRMKDLSDVNPGCEVPAYADITGAAGTNLELRAPLTPYEITYPGGVSGRPRDEQIPLGDLDVRYDQRTNNLRLQCRRTGTWVVPQHLGTTAVFLLPPMNRFLLDMFGEASYIYLRQGLSGLAWSGQPREVKQVPRLCLNRLVINRARWIVASDVMPRRTGTLAEYLLDLTRWRRMYGIPEQCFVRMAEPSTQARPTANAKARKPLYVDFTSPYFVRIIDDLRERRDGVLMFEEMLPSADDAVVTAASAGYATEFVIESVLGGMEDD